MSKLLQFRFSILAERELPRAIAWERLCRCDPDLARAYPGGGTAEAMLCVQLLCGSAVPPDIAPYTGAAYPPLTAS